MQSNKKVNRILTFFMNDANINQSHFYYSSSKTLFIQVKRERGIGLTKDLSSILVYIKVLRTL